MKRRPFNGLRASLATACGVAALGLHTGALAAHELATATARVTLRDDHVDVLADVDVLAYVVQTSGVGGALAVATAGDEALGEMVRRARETLRDEARLEADGARVDLEVTDFPSKVEIRALAEWFVAAPRAHGELRALHLEAARPVAGARRIALTLPPAMGPVLVTFVQPSSQWAQPGATAAFSVLGAPSPDPPARTGPLLPRLPLAGTAVALALAAVLANLALRRRADDRKATRQS